MAYNPYYMQPMNSWGNSYGMSGGMQSPAQMPQSGYGQGMSGAMPEPMKWIDGEAGAMAFQMPPGWPVNQPIALWDSQSQTIYLKSWNQMGMSNKIQKLTYQMVEEPVGNLPGGQSGGAEYATKQEIEHLQEEIRNLNSLISRQGMRSNQNGSNRGENNGKPTI